MPLITIDKNSFEIEEGSNLRTSLIENGHDIKSPCGGSASCGQCVVMINKGAENLSEFSFEEKQILGNVFHITKERLSCQTNVFGDIDVDISRHLEQTEVKPKTIKRTKEQIIQNEKLSVERPPKEGGYRKPRAFKEFKDKK